MPAYVLHMNASIACPHAGQVQAVSAHPNVRLSGQPILTVSDQFPIVGCTFTVGNKPQPCVAVTWTPSSHITANGQSVLLASTVGVCRSAEQIPQGPPSIAGTQTLVTGS